jgi:hypothetical protein
MESATSDPTTAVFTTTDQEDITTTFDTTSATISSIILTTTAEDSFHGTTFGYGILVGLVMVAALLGIYIGWRQLQKGRSYIRLP